MIDWRFIGELEGQGALTGYVPTDAAGNVLGHSGVTVATGVDLGQMTAIELPRLHLPDALRAKVLPYIGVQGAGALALLAARPLTISQAESDMLDAADRATEIEALELAWLRAVPRDAPFFNMLPDACQTVIASVAFQYGPALRRRCPRFWGRATALDWAGAIAELRDFGDAYPTRRHREADYLEAWLGTMAQPALSA